MSLAGFVLAAGLGTRIGALSRFRPKPLLPIGLGTSFERAVAALRAAGASPIVANASHLSEQVVSAGRALGVEVVVERDGPYGTAGGVAHARALLDADAIAVWNGDIVADVDVRALHALLRSASAVAALAVRGRAPVGGGNVGVAEDGRIVRLRNQSIGTEAFGAWFAAVQVLDRTLVARAPDRGCLVGDLLIPALAEGARVVALDYAGPWHDVGDPPSYLAANLAEGTRVAEGAMVAPGVNLQRVIVGKGARVEGAGVLADVVVWPGARAVAPLRSAVVVDSGEVVHVPPPEMKDR